MKHSREQLKKEEANRKALVKACDDVSQIIRVIVIVLCNLHYLCTYYVHMYVCIYCMHVYVYIYSTFLISCTYVLHTYFACIMT